MPQPALVSIVVPVYNAERFLARCVDSLQSQSYAPVEILLVDDGSTDGSGKLCDALAAADPRVRVFHQANAGPSAARNLALEAAKGAYLTFVDADDFISVGMVGTMVESLETTESGLAVCTYMSHLFDGDRQIATSVFRLEAQRLTVDDFLSLATLKIEDPASVRARAHVAGNIWGKLYRTDVIRRKGLRFDPALMRYEDIQFNFSYMSGIEKITVINKDLYHYCVFSDHASLSDRMTRKNFGMAAASYDAVRRSLEGRSRDYFNYYYSYIVMGYLIRLFQKGSPFSFAEAVAEMKAVSATPMYGEVMAHYRRPQGASVLVPALLKLRLFLLASAAAKARMLKASMGNKPVRQWCFSQS